MDVRTLPLKVSFILILLISLTRNVCAQSAEERLNFSLADSVLIQLDDFEKQDSLAPWMSILKSQSQIERAANNTINAIDLLTKCIAEKWRDPNTEKEAVLLGWIYVNRAYLYDQKQGDYLAAKKDYLSALEWFEKYDFQDFYVGCYLIQPLGNIYTRLGENEQAIGMLDEFQRICRNENQLDALMNSYNDLGRAFMNKEAYEEAVELFKVGTKIDEMNWSNLGLIQSSMAEAQLYLGQFDDAVVTANHSLENLKKAQLAYNKGDFRLEATSRYMAGTLTTLGFLYLKKNAFDQSLAQFQQALSIAEKFYQGKHRRKAKILNGIGDCYNHFERYEESLTAYQTALTQSVAGFDNEDVFTNPSDDLLFADVVISEALIAKAETAAKIYDKSLDTKWLNLSADTYQTYFRWVKKLRAQQLNVQSKLSLTGEIHQTAEEALKVLLKLNTVEGIGERNKLAFEIIEQTKGILLAESDVPNLLSTGAPQAAGELDELDALKMQKSLFQIDMNTMSGSEFRIERDRLKQNIEALDRKISILDFKLREKYRAYDRLKLERESTIDFELLTAYLTEQKAELFTFFLGNENLFLIHVSNGEFNFYSIDFESYTKSAPRFFEQLNNRQLSDAANYEAAAENLYQILFNAIDETSKNNWLIIPDGELNLIPFEALVDTRQGSAASFKKMNYLLRNRVIHYAPSVKFILENKNNPVGDKFYLGMAPIFKNTENFSELTHSKEELTYANSLFDGEVFFNENATKQRFISVANDYALIHLSTHAGVGTGNNNDGWIAFHGTNEKMLTPELLQLNLSAGLVILNGCETGIGKIYKGEGMLSMARGFIQSGAQSAITNLWQVNHEANAKLMENFYGHLQGGNSPAFALNQAKLAYVNNQEVDETGAHPHFWAASILVGTNADLNLETTSNDSFYTGLIIGGAILLLFIVIFFMRRQRS